MEGILVAYLTVKSVQEVKKIIQGFMLRLEVEKVCLGDSVGRKLAEDILAPSSLPPYHRSAVDGYCVSWEDVSGASETLPVFLNVIDNIEMGKAPKKELKRDTAINVATGSMLPKGANAVVMVEHTEKLGPHEVAIYNSVASFENVLKEGEDIIEGEKILSTGTKITPENISLLAALGISEVKVSKRPVVGVISTGDELVELGQPIALGEIYNSNGPGIVSAIKEKGGIPKYYGIVKDDFNTLKDALRQAIEECNIVILTGGTSVGTKDFVMSAIDSLGCPGVLVHGIAMKPGKPTIIGKIKEVPIFGLSGNPMSALLGFRLFVQDLISPSSPSTVFLEAKVKRNIPSAGGREDYIPVKLEKDNGENYVTPIFSKSNSIGSLTKMDGLLIIDKDSEGLQEGRSGIVMLKEGYDNGLLK